MYRVAVLGEHADSLVPPLAGQFTELEFLAITAPEQVSSSLARFAPNVAFSIKSPAFPGHFHRMLGECDSLKWLHVGGSGFDHLLPWHRQDVMLTNCAGVLARHLADTVIGMVLALNVNAPQYLRQQQQKLWLPHSFRPISEQTILVIGVGQIGSWVAHHAKLLGMHVIGVRRNQDTNPWTDRIVSPEQVEDVLGEADYVTLHVRLNGQTAGMFGSSMFERMKPGSCFLNTSRGAVVDELALIAALRSGHLRGAYLDVFQHEPLLESSPLWELENVIITPHAADDVIGWQNQFTRFFADNLRRLLSGEPLANIIKP